MSDWFAVDSCYFLDHLVDGAVAELPHDHRNNGRAEDRGCAVCIHRFDNGAGLQAKLANKRDYLKRDYMLTTFGVSERVS